MARASVRTALLSVWALAACAPLPPATSAAPAVLVNSLGMTLVRVPAGEFWMGSDEPIDALQKDFPGMGVERFRELSDEAPVHKVRITRDFYMGATEVTVAQFRQFVARSGYVPESVADGTGGYGYNPQYDRATSQRGDAFEGRDLRYSWQQPGFTQTDSHPVVNITWNDAQALVQWLSQQEGRRYQLPTEAQWEYAARAGTRTRYHSGDAPQSLAKVANTFDTSATAYWREFVANALPVSDGHAFTAPVASYAPNAWGLYDMHGNVWEWTQDLYGADYYAKSPVKDPTGPSEGGEYVRRGGSWHTWALYARASYRNWNSPQTRYTLVGMRLVLQP